MPDRSCSWLMTPACSRGRLKHVVNGADADRPAQHVTHELENAAIRTPAHQRQRDDHLAQPSLGDLYLEQHRIVRGGGDESLIQSATGLVCLLVDELAAHPVPDSQIADRLRSRQRHNGQLLTVNFRQPRRRANIPLHVRTHLKKSRWHHPPWQRQPGFACDPALNHIPPIGIGAEIRRAAV